MSTRGCGIDQRTLSQRIATRKMRFSKLTLGSCFRQVSFTIILLLLTLVLLIYLKRRLDSQTEANICTVSQNTLKLQLSDHGHNKNGFVGNDKCCNAVNGVSLEHICGNINHSEESSQTLENVNSPDCPQYGPPQCTCANYFYCKLVVVSSMSSNHFSEATDMILSVQRKMPNTRIIMYSLGLTNNEMSLLKSYCNVELRVFDFSKYPNLQRNLRTFTWKPLVVQEVSQEYEVVLYFDSSIRLTNPIHNKILGHLRSSPAFIAGPWFGKRCYKSDKPIVSFTHDETLKYLFPHKSQDIVALRKELSVWGHLQAGCWLMWLNHNMKEKLLKNWVDCALHEGCMAPRQANIDGCLANLIFSDYASGGKYTGCHRYDQSALNLILYREFGISSLKSICHDYVLDLMRIQKESNADLFFHIFLAVVFLLVSVIIFLNWYFTC